MNQKPIQSAFTTDKRIKVGIWGLGRGRGFYQSARFCPMDVVKTCVFSVYMKADRHGE